MKAVGTALATTFVSLLQSTGLILAPLMTPPERYTVPITSLELNQGVANHYYMDVTAGQTVLCLTNGPNGDADLYMRFGEPAVLDPNDDMQLQNIISPRPKFRWQRLHWIHCYIE